MSIEQVRPRPGSDQYARRRKYITVDGKRKAVYEEYLGKVGTDTVGALAESKNILAALNADINGFHSRGQPIPDKLAKRATREAKKRDLLEIQLIEDEKGSKLTKIERGIITELNASDYKEVTELMVLHIDRQYKAGDGLKALSTSLKANGIDVSPNTIGSYLKDKGIYEKREFGHERKVTEHEWELQKQIDTLKRENESLKITLGVK